MESSPLDHKSVGEVARDLTDKNRAFIYHLVHGKSESGNRLTVYEAYQNAGYDGDKHAAYQLKSRLEKEIMEAEVTRGATKADIFREIADLMTLPTVGKDGSAVTGISVAQKVKLLGLAVKAHDMVKTDAPRITAININMGGSAPAQKAEEPPTVVDVTPEEEKKD